MGSMTPKTEILFRPTRTISAKDYYPGYVPPTNLTKGSVLLEGHLPLPCDILFEHDVPIKMRDGVTLYADVFRPPNAKPGTVPALIMAGPFGKNGGPNRYHFDKWPWRMGCPRRTTSGLEKFEALDPAYWCFHGYAIVHTDNRGTWKSEGVAMPGCVKEGEDGHDIVEFLAQQHWCNGKVSMAGNSYLAQTQWFVGAENPPHLACLAPWEGWSDLYNDTVRHGGIHNPGFIDGLLETNLAGQEGRLTEDLAAMTAKYPCWNDYWEDRRAKVAKIQCPLYVVASWTNSLHTYGTFRAYVESGSKEKWLRIHNSHEWPDLYNSKNMEDLKSFYDYYMKGVNNDWIYTPKVRISVLDAGGVDVVHRPEREFPLARQVPHKLFLDTTNQSLSLTKPPQQTSCSYDAESGSLVFSYTMPETAEFTGYFKLRLWVEAVGSDDMDLFVFLQKHSASGKPLESITVDVGRMYPDPEAERQELLRQHALNPSFCEGYFDSGPSGRLRVSHRALNEEKSTDFHPVYTHEKEELLRAGEVVPVDVAFWPYGMICKKGEILKLTVTGVNKKPHLRPTDLKPQLRNRGQHKIYAGEGRESYLLLPLISTVR